MKQSVPWPALGLAAAVLIVAIVGWRLLSRGGEDKAPAPSALTSLARVRAETVEDTADAYGVVQADPSASHVISAPRALIVDKVLVRPGQAVAAGAVIMVVSGAPASQQAYRQAADAAAFAARDLERIKRMVDERLATNEQLSAAKKTLADARAALAAQTAAGGQLAIQQITAPAGGVVSTVSASPGEHVAADAPLATLGAVNGLTAVLGVEPADAPKVRPGQRALITSVFDPTQQIASQITSVAAMIDPTSRLINAGATLQGATLPLGAAVRGQIVVGSHPGLLVPRAAVVDDEAGAHLFVVSGGKARQVAVRELGEYGDLIEVAGPLTAADQVAVAGAYELQDGMAVRTGPR